MSLSDSVGHVRVLSVPFENVLGSRGSILNFFRDQVAAGGPVTVTDLDVTRCTMMVREAVHLVGQGAGIGSDRLTTILDMGTPVRIVDVAQQVIDSPGCSIDLVFVALRPAGKLHEVFIGANDQRVPSSHPLITQIRVTSLPPSSLNDISLLAKDVYQVLAIIANTADGTEFAPESRA